MHTLTPTLKKKKKKNLSGDLKHRIRFLEEQLEEALRSASFTPLKAELLPKVSLGFPSLKAFS